MTDKREPEEKQPVLPRDAASVLLLRDHPHSGCLEVLMVRRHEGSVFAGGMHVFPGGELEDGDCDPGWVKLCYGPSPEELRKLSRDGTHPARALGLMIAGVRELFEEAGILLAVRNPEGTFFIPGKEDVLFREHRAKLREGKLDFQELVRDLGLRLALDRLVFFAHWITPEISPIRYDTRFFLAPAPPGQDPDHDRAETTSCLWTRPEEALRLCGEGRFPLLPPTMANLHALSDFRDLREALVISREREVPTILPRFDV